MPGARRRPRADLRAHRILAELLAEVLIAVSCSKNFDLHGDRTGCVMVVGSSGRALRHDETALQNAVRTLYSMPPRLGAVVATVLEDERLWAAWLGELDGMRHRISANRADLVARLRALGHGEQATSLVRHKGMFSMLPFTPDQMRRLRGQFGIYGTTSRRIHRGCLRAPDPIPDARHRRRP
ncbi:hypothetical protein AV521_08975 [Streptomyces sp. IMTB 2501]|uniref:aminotransferase class I/II-fold pyridoxal phosphate-dependent enzyme n=1 Tax=Streptomyces sp. IMTB 2501 TaxID=1776340 RepID=UPI00096C840B|nr:aminotransferase class I/II-fold pyridoxal phosphate-dependent enzyme [Streptomyces sp. IMTB 2501]OLZ72050.1 hypothetical protein AV521_08975 [Streptomyces sp. IMTB 2501]